MGGDAAMLLLADGRFPVGSHAHSGGVEAAVLDGRVADLATLERFTRGRLATTGLTEAGLAAATVVLLLPCTTTEPMDATEVVAVLTDLDAEAEARLAPPPLRAASRRLGRQLARVGMRSWPGPLLDLVTATSPAGLHQPVALGATGVAAGLDAGQVAWLAVHHALTLPAQAAVRLLGLDPFAAAALTAALAGDAARVVADALAAAQGPLAELPARTGPLLDIAAVEHERRDERLFAT